MTMGSKSVCERTINKNDDYCGYLSNGAWFHIQPQNVFEAVK